MKKVLFLMILPFLILGTASVNGQVRIGGESEPNKAAVLDLNASDDVNNGTLGLALPRVSLGALSGKGAELINGVTPLNGMLVYNTNGDLGVGLYYWSTSTWVKLNVGEIDPGLTDASNGLAIDGNKVKLGGSLTEATTIETAAGKDLSITGTGKVSIGAAPGDNSAKFEVNGSAANTSAFDANGSTTIEFSNSNLAFTTVDAGTSFTLNGMKNGGTYTLAVRGETSGALTFTAPKDAESNFTVKILNDKAKISGKDALYTFIVMGETVYVFVTTDFIITES
jgi:hypothetical protein